MGPSQYIDHHLVEKQLSQEEILLREEFVKEYLKTRDAYKSCIALGFMEAYAKDWSKKLMEDGYVLRLILAKEREEDSPGASTERQKKYRAWMEKEATYYGPGSQHGSRVSAIAHLMKMEGIDTPSKSDNSSGVKGGVMVVPALVTVDEWSKLAAKSQSELKAKVKE